MTALTILAADRNVVAAPLPRAAGRHARKTLTGRFVRTGGSVRAGFLRLAYVKPGFSRPAYHIIASGDVRGWRATCDCLSAGARGSCKHSERVRALAPHWPSDDADLLPLTEREGDGTDGLCPCGCGAAVHRATWYVPGRGYLSLRVGAGCGWREVVA